MASITPIGVAQRKVLDALGLTAVDFGDANRVFETIGIEVFAKRVGRSSDPVIVMKETEFGGFNREGEGETWSKTFKAVDLTAVKQWMK